MGSVVRKRLLWAAGLVLVATAVGAQVITAPGARYFAQHLRFASDNTFDIGASGANRPNEIFTGGAITSGTSVYASGGNLFGSSSRSVFQSPSDGVLMMSNQAQTDFGRLQFGGTTSSFPALKRSASAIQARLADDSDYTTVAAGSFSSALGGGGYLAVASSAAASNPGTNTVRLYVREDLDSSGAGGVDCDLVARLNSGTEVLITRLVLNGGCP